MTRNERDIENLRTAAMCQFQKGSVRKLYIACLACLAEEMCVSDLQKDTAPASSLISLRGKEKKTSAGSTTTILVPHRNQ